MTSSPFSSFADAATLGDVLLRNAATRPDKIAFRSPDGRSVSFAGFNDRVNRLNNAVAALGLRKGARIAILSRNRQEYVESYGLSKSGLIIVPLNWRLSGAELTLLVADSAPELHDRRSERRDHDPCRRTRQLPKRCGDMLGLTEHDRTLAVMQFFTPAGCGITCSRASRAVAPLS